MFVIVKNNMFIHFITNDKDIKVRRTTATVLGRHWIWGKKPQNQEAVKIMMELSKDDNVEVRHKAVY